MIDENVGTKYKVNINDMNFDTTKKLALQNLKDLNYLKTIAGQTVSPGIPIEIDDETNMNNILNNISNIGKIYKFVGTSNTFISGSLYLCYDDGYNIY